MLLWICSDREKALTMYIFTRNTKVQQAFLEETTCGSVCINDVIMQFTGESRNYRNIPLDFSRHPSSVDSRLSNDFSFLTTRIVKRLWFITTILVAVWRTTFNLTLLQTHGYLFLNVTAKGKIRCN